MKAEPWTARRLEAGIDQFMQYLPAHATPNWQLGSHDVTRTAQRIGQGQARVAAMLQMMLPGTAFLYYGDEIGLENIVLRADQVRDPYTSFGRGRDFYRAPMPWTGEDGAGFSSVVPWLPLPTDCARRNVQAQEADERSLLHLYRRLIALRHSHPALRNHAFTPMRSRGNVLQFRRGDGAHCILVVLNISEEAAMLDEGHRGDVVLSTCLDGERPIEGPISLRPDEGLIIELT